MENRDRYSLLCKATIQDPVSGNVLHSLIISASKVLSDRSRNPYRKVRAVSADGTVYFGYVRGQRGNNFITVSHSPLTIALYVGSEKLEFTYSGTSDTVTVDQSRSRSDRRPSPGPQASNSAWPHVEAIIRTALAKDPSGASRIRRAVALLFHADAAGSPIDEPDLLARANDLIDTLAPRGMALTQ